MSASRTHDPNRRGSAERAPGSALLQAFRASLREAGHRHDAPPDDPAAGDAAAPRPDPAEDDGTRWDPDLAGPGPGGWGTGPGEESRSWPGASREPGPPPGHGHRGPGGPEAAAAAAELIDLVLRMLDQLWRLLPPELRRHWRTIQREALLTLRSIIDHALERLDREEGPTRVEDIPID